jgi:hypothetical protein
MPPAARGKAQSAERIAHGVNLVIRFALYALRSALCAFPLVAEGIIWYNGS